jgi:cell division protein FtsZ
MSEWEIIEEVKENASIKVIGVGGGGGNAVQHMVESGIEGAEFISVNTDRQALDKNDASTKLILGMEITDGLGAGANPAIGREAALEDRDKLREMLKGTDMVFVTAGMGGGTGTGAAPIVGFAPAPNPSVISIPKMSFVLASFLSKACLSVLTDMNSAPSIPDSTMC